MAEQLVEETKAKRPRFTSAASVLFPNSPEARVCTADQYRDATAEQLQINAKLQEKDDTFAKFVTAALIGPPFLAATPAMVLSTF